MNPQTESKISRIEKYSARLRVFCTALLVPAAVLPVALAVAAFVVHGSTINYFGQTIPLADLTTGGRAALAILSLLSGVVLVKALLHLRRLLCNYAKREIFTADSARQVRHFGESCMLWGLLKIAWAFLPLMVRGQSVSSIQLSGDTILLGGIIVVLSWFAEMAAELREENELTI
jgi:hypothetical protein